MNGKRKRGRPPKHGAYSTTELAPLTDKKIELIERILSGEGTVLTPVDAIAKELLARNLAKIEMIDRYLHEHGLFVDEVKGLPQPILKVYWMALNSAARMCESLGLTPTARARLGLKVARTIDLASQIYEAKRLTEGKKNAQTTGN